MSKLLYLRSYISLGTESAFEILSVDHKKVREKKELSFEMVDQYKRDIKQKQQGKSIVENGFIE